MYYKKEGVLKMNIAMIKLAMIEKRALEQEAMNNIEGYSSNPIDREFLDKITKLLNKVKKV